MSTGKPGVDVKQHQEIMYVWPFTRSSAGHMVRGASSNREHIPHFQQDRPAIRDKVRIKSRGGGQRENGATGQKFETTEDSGITCFYACLLLA